METQSRNHKINLYTPQGIKLTQTISGLVKLEIEITETQDISFRINFDGKKVEDALSKFLAESLMSGTVKMDYEVLKSISLTCGSKSYVPFKGYDCGLTEKEAQIMDEVVKGNSDKEISEILKMKIYTIKTHLKIINIKLKAKNRTHAAVIYLERCGRLINPSQDVMLVLTKLGYFNELN